jgi:hypothetical protein
LPPRSPVCFLCHDCLVQLRHLKRVLSPSTRLESIGRLPAAWAELVAETEAALPAMDITDGCVRILLGPAEDMPCTDPSESADVPTVQALSRKITTLSLEELKPSFRAAVEESGGRFVKFPVVAIPATDMNRRVVESALVWPVKLSQPGPFTPTGGDDVDEAISKRMMEFAVEAARRGRAAGFRGAGAVVFDPQAGCLRAWAYDRTHWLGGDSSLPAPGSVEGRELTHPLHSAALLVIEAIAAADRKRRGKQDLQREPHAELMREHKKVKWKRPRSPDSTEEGASAKHVKVMDEAAFEVQANEHGDDGSLHLGSYDFLYDAPLLRLPEGAPDPPVPGFDQYICNGYDVYLSVEPSAMDAMALSHARVRRVYFAAADPLDGALVSCIRLHEARSLNHHYQVFQMDPSDALTVEARRLWEEAAASTEGDPFAFAKG